MGIFFSLFVKRKEKLSRIFEALAYTIVETSHNTLGPSYKDEKKNPKINGD